MPTLEENIRKSIEKTGFPTEIKVHKILTERNWSATNQYSFIDESDNKLRSVDFVAKYMSSFDDYQVLNVGDKKIKVPVSLVRDLSEIRKPCCYIYIECKKSDNRFWVFYTKDSRISPFRYRPYRNGAIINGVKQKKGIELISEINITGQPYFFQKLAFSYQIAFMKGNEKDQFYEAQMQVLKSIEYSKDLSLFDQDKDILFSVIVFDGKMYECDVIEDVIKLSEIEYIRYISSGLPEYNLQVCIDVMTLEYFPKYLEFLEREIKKNDV